MPKKLSNGCVVIFEGMDGVGKTTQLELARSVLAEEDWPVYATRNLGGTPIGEELRKVMKSPLERPAATDLYIAAAIQEALIGDIGGRRQAEDLILIDRSPLSLIAYEVFGSGAEEETGWEHTNKGMLALKPELIILFKASIKESLGRIKTAKGQDYFDHKPIDYFERVAKGYETVAKKYENVVLIDANRSIEEVHTDTMAVIRKTLAKHA